MVTRWKGGWREVAEGKGGQMEMEGDLTKGGEHTMQYIDDVL